MKIDTGLPIIVAPALLHLGWVAVLIGEPRPIHATPIDPFYFAGSPNAVCEWLIIVTLLAFAGHFFSRKESWCYWASLVPQQAALMISTISSYECVTAGTFADGYAPVGGWKFIFIGEWPHVVPVIVHSIYLLWLFAVWMESVVTPITSKP